MTITLWRPYLHTSSVWCQMVALPQKCAVIEVRNFNRHYLVILTYAF